MIQILHFNPMIRGALLGLLLGVAFFLLLVTLKTNNPEQPWQLTKSTQVGGPFETSNTTARYALTQAVIENHRLTLDVDQAKFAVPDVVEKNGAFVISFTPGISFLAAGYYVLGQALGIAPVAPFFLSITFSLINGILIYLLAKKFGSREIPAILSSGIFLFATNALVYAATLTQHHGSTTIILLSILNALEKRTWWRNALFGIYCGIGFLFDFPNLFLLFPIGLYILTQHIQIKSSPNRLSFNLQTSSVLIVIGLVPLLILFAFYNYASVGSPTTFAQFSARTSYFDSTEKKQANEIKNQTVDPYQPTLPFNTRQQLEGVYILLFSDERSWLWYSPVLWFGLVGMWLLYQKNSRVALLIIAIVCVNILIYSMFGDPWGGWSFGSRYLIPSAALMSSAIGLALTRYGKSFMFAAILLLFVGYSVAISTAGALTTAAIPPKQESKALTEYVPWTYTYNFRLLQQNRSHSLIYHLGIHLYLTSNQFYLLYVCFVMTGLTVMTLSIPIMHRKRRA